MQSSFVLLYLTAIVAANLIITRFGPGASIVTALVFIGFDFTSRDKLHEAWHRKGLVWKMGILILAGSAISYALNRNSARIAVASFVAFAAAAIIDTIIYSLLYRKKYLIKTNGSNVFSSLVDSIIFPTLAFGSFMPLIILGQFAAKFGGGLVWSFLLKSRRDGRWVME